MKAGRELDKTIAIEVMGWVKNGHRQGFWCDPQKPDSFYGAGYTFDGRDYDFADFAPSESIECAWEVVEKVKGDRGPLDGFALYYNGNWHDSDGNHVGQWIAGWRGEGHPECFSGPNGVGLTAPLAICLAALSAVGSPVAQEDGSFAPPETTYEETTE